jgi:hypothetical protein
VSLPQSLRVMIRRQEPYIIGRSSTPSQDGSFILGGLPEGRYSVTVTSLPADSYVSDMFLGSQSIFNDLIVPVHVEAPPPLNIILRKGGGTIEGVVQDEQKRGVPSTLVLVPSPARRKNSMLYKTAYATAGGRFRINAVAPGEYKLFAFEIPPPSGAMEYDGFISGYEDRGVSVTVSDGDLSNVTVAEIPAP